MLFPGPTVLAQGKECRASANGVDLPSEDLELAREVVLAVFSGRSWSRLIAEAMVVSSLLPKASCFPEQKLGHFPMKKLNPPQWPVRGRNGGDVAPGLEAVGTELCHLKVWVQAPGPLPCVLWPCTKLRSESRLLYKNFFFPIRLPW